MFKWRGGEAVAIAAKPGWDMAMKIEGEFQKDPKDQGYLESSKLSNKKQNPSIASSLMAKEIECL